MVVKSLNGVPENDICNALNDAFSDYVIQFQIPSDRFPKIARRRGADYGLSVGMFDDERLVGFIINGGGEWNGKRTVYDCFTGVICAFKGRGIAPEMFREGLESFKEIGYEQYLLEVITENRKAYNIYEKTGFRISRVFNVYRQDADKIKVAKNNRECVSIISVERPDWVELKKFWDIYPSWQNSIDSIMRVREDFEIHCAYMYGKCVGYIAVESKTGDVAQIAVSKDCRRKGIGSSLIGRVMENKNKNYRLSFLNVDERCVSFIYFADFLNIPLILKQYEMVLEI